MSDEIEFPDKAPSTVEELYAIMVPIFIEQQRRLKLLEEALVQHRHPYRSIETGSVHV